MKLYVVRHCETNYNVAGICNADPAVDVHLTDLGIQQASGLRDQLSSRILDRVFVSELPRTLQTAEIIVGDRGFPIAADKRLNENETGFENQPVTDWLVALERAPDKWNARFNGGESLEDTYARVADFISWLRRQPYESVLIVTHGTLALCIGAVVENRTISEVFRVGTQQGVYRTFDLN